MESATKISYMALHFPSLSPKFAKNSSWICIREPRTFCKFARGIFHSGSVSAAASHEAESTFVGDVNGRRSRLESLFCYDKTIPEERIEKPTGLAMGKKAIGDNPHCAACDAKGAVLCLTCSGSGLYVDSILESQGIVVKVRCLGCGGTGNSMCAECGGRGHL